MLLQYFQEVYLLLLSREIKASEGLSVVSMQSVCVCEWNFSHVSQGSEGQLLQENPHIPQRTGTHLFAPGHSEVSVNLNACMCEQIRLAETSLNFFSVL